MDLDSPPPMKTMRAMARKHGMAVKTTSAGRYWLVRQPVGPTDPGELLSPRRGVTAEELWVMLTAPQDHPLYDEVAKTSVTKPDPVPNPDIKDGDMNKIDLDDFTTESSTTLEPARSLDDILAEDP